MSFFYPSSSYGSTSYYTPRQSYPVRSSYSDYVDPYDYGYTSPAYRYEQQRLQQERELLLRRRQQQLEEEEEMRREYQEREEMRRMLAYKAAREAARERAVALEMRKRELRRLAELEECRQALSEQHFATQQSSPSPPELLPPSHLPATSPSAESSPASSRSGSPTPNSAELEQAASTIQRFYRARALRAPALASLSTLTTTFSHLRDSYIPPLLLDVDTASSAEAPKLLYTANNAPFHQYEDSLIRLLTQVDGVATNGDEKVKKARKTLVREIEAELAALDERKSEEWKTMEEKKDGEQTVSEQK